MDISTKIEGHRFGCPVRGEPMHQACVVADDGSILRRIDPSYEQLRAEVERLRAKLEHEKAERDLDIESGGQAVEQLQIERDRLRAVLFKIADDSAHADQYVRWAQEVLGR